MDARISQIQAEMRQVAEDARAAFGSYSGEQLNWKPGPDSWSIAQCLDHIIKTNHEFYPEFDLIASGNRKNTFWQSYSPFTGMTGRFLVNAVKTDSKKAKAPSKSIIPPSDVAADIVEQFAGHIEEVISKLQGIVGVDVRNTVVSSPFLSAMTYTLEDGLTVLVEHSKRHIRQAKRVLEADGFPK
ncbi:MAG: DinB family protein [Pyrinomonadaceae bacterium]|nr:DinB family protein [Pyrinomonadaceae bacterium]